MSNLEKWLSRADETDARVREWRRHFHRYPELSFEEHETSRYIYETLENIGGFELSRPTPTSVVARLSGGRPGPVLALRADIDALAIHEENTFEFASERPGVMHACGHDSHAAVLLGAAQILAAERQSLRGELRLIFQHAEETPPGGAQELVEAGVLDGVDAIFGLHLLSWLDTGRIGLIEGAVMAATDNFDLTVRGNGGHAAYPHHGADAIAASAQVIANLQHIVARQTDPMQQAVLSVTRIRGGEAYNVFPEKVEIGGTVRSFDPELREDLLRRIRHTAGHIAQAHGASVELSVQKGYPALYNDASLVALAERVTVSQFGEASIERSKPTMGAEDFAAYTRQIPGAFIYIGARSEAKESHYPHHHPRFTVDEDGMKTALRFWLALVDQWQLEH
ncbi:amidohydrolase [Saccharibacillus sp. CPCC 101409]|uniref:M20 metallopeptidase family protein n=1 Tax=Saccharibacillus sp. CPCC 101409 TaxID=3058041 RepID=UPI0026731D7E|nr:amidohydrolase [Saccharibacillus sp. CPCC 101409]MDO3408208.1 amidohydrolase [Saccharibacillus sp. CPCC 101409]